MIKRVSCWVVAFTVLFGILSLRADVRLPGVFSDHAVLQRGLPLVIWGWADPGEAVKVAIGGQSLSAVAGKDGAWRVKLAPLEMRAEPLELVVTGKNTIMVKDLIVGDVWICSGQSNMEFGLSGADNSREALPAATNTMIRLLNIRNPMRAEPGADVSASWMRCSPETARDFSAVGYFFGKRLQEETGVPIGLINNAWGGSAIEPWTSQEAWDRIDELRVLGTNAPVRGQIYNGRVAPLVPYGIKGAIWYQGESNGNEGEIYFHKMRALISCWRHAWREYAAEGESGDGGLPEYQFPFYYVQLANCKRPSTSPGGGGRWTRLRMAQLKALSIPKTGMAVAIDVGSRTIHPGNKQDVGTRLALWALANDYGLGALVCSGPLYKGMDVQDGAISIRFDYVGSGLMIGRKEGYGPAVDAAALAVDEGGEPAKLNSFGIAGDDRQWFAGEAVIDGSTVLVSSTNVPSPVAVRYAFNTYPLGCNLYNREGLPASPFRTDDWE